jgi:hypothetical protein
MAAVPSASRRCRYAGVDPGVRHHLGAVHGTHVLLVGLHDLVDHLRGQEAFLDEERLEGPDAMDHPGLGFRMMTAHAAS